MPAYASSLTDAEIARLAAYLRRTRTKLPPWTDLETKRRCRPPAVGGISLTQRENWSQAIMTTFISMAALFQSAARMTHHCCGSSATSWASQEPSSAAGLGTAAPARCMWRVAPRDPVSPRSASVAGAKVTTIEGLDPEGKHPLQAAWIELQVPQCGYCQSGQIMQAATLLKDYPDPTDQDINAVMAGSLCRCMTYVAHPQGDQAGGGENARRNRSWIASSAHGPGAPDQPSRRGFLITMMGAGVMLGYARSGLAAVEFLASGTQEFLPSGTHRETSAGELFEPTIWYGIDPSGTVTVNIIRAEMGQHVGTALARIVADELEADWDKVRSWTVDSDPKWGVMFTGGSWSVWQSFPLLSRAGAAGRIALIEEGAKLLGVSVQSCTARNGAVHAKRKSILYGDIVARGDLRRTYTPEQLDEIPIKAPAKRHLIGRDTLALDVPSKTNGKGRYGLDAVVEGMVYARPKVPPTRYDSKVVSVDDSAAKRVAGYIQSLASGRSVGHGAGLGHGLWRTASRPPTERPIS